MRCSYQRDRRSFPASSSEKVLLISSLFHNLSLLSISSLTLESRIELTIEII
ncbi:hypothetical protein F383_36843 [Gossypium arboreum]|uniref:Uncharacterized protein n=1 Tax=Gossypium arboreum TaxID=29729 RepID=A0A0B0M9R3_GOSAR|nr:hypothetical protein F383_36843 [Gossypium arboreum]